MIDHSILKKIRSSSCFGMKLELNNNVKDKDNKDDD